MCSAIRTTDARPGLGAYRKGNEPEGSYIFIKGDWVGCECGEQKYFRASGNTVWVPAEPVPVLELGGA